LKLLAAEALQYLRNRTNPMGFWLLQLQTHGTYLHCTILRSYLLFRRMMPELSSDSEYYPKEMPYNANRLNMSTKLVSCDQGAPKELVNSQQNLRYAFRPFE
jgi:hypothetical protein